MYIYSRCQHDHEKTIPQEPIFFNFDFFLIYIYYYYYTILCFIASIPQMSWQGLISKILISQNRILRITSLNEQIVN